MGLCSLSELLSQARQRGYALGYFEAWDQYSLEAVLEASEEVRSPAILGFGAAVTSQDWLDSGGLEDLACLARRMAERATVPAAVLFNEARTFTQIRRALDAGCNAVMLDSSHLAYEENVSLTRSVVAAARQYGASVEAELGCLLDASDPEADGSVLTDPAQAAAFVQHTGVDALAVSIGNAHLVVGREVAVDLELLEHIHCAVSVPLVVHGGTGFPRSAVRTAIRCGVAKFNVGTRLKGAFLAGVSDALPDLAEGRDIHRYVGSHTASDVLGCGKARIRAEILDLMGLYGSVGQVQRGNRE